MSINKFNSLPAKPEYIEEVRRILNQNAKLTLFEASKVAKISRTQLACAIEEMIKTDQVYAIVEKKKTYYALKQN